MSQRPISLVPCASASGTASEIEDVRTRLYWICCTAAARFCGKLETRGRVAFSVLTEEEKRQLKWKAWNHVMQKTFIDAGRADELMI